jgi:hypothetical protein
MYRKFCLLFVHLYIRILFEMQNFNTYLCQMDFVRLCGTIFSLIVATHEKFAYLYLYLILKAKVFLLFCLVWYVMESRPSTRKIVSVRTAKSWSLWEGADVAPMELSVGSRRKLGIANTVLKKISPCPVIDLQDAISTLRNGCTDWNIHYGFFILVQRTSIYASIYRIPTQSRRSSER